MGRKSDKAGGEKNKEDPKRGELKGDLQIDWRSFEEEGFELFDLDDEDNLPS